MEEWLHIVAERNVSLREDWIAHWGATQSSPDLAFINLLRKKHPDHALVTLSESPLEALRPLATILNFPETRVTVLEGSDEPIINVGYEPPVKRAQGRGALTKSLKFSQLRLEWANEVFLLVIAIWREGFNEFGQVAILNPEKTAEPVIHELILSAAAYANELREQILTFENGSWSKNHDLWLEVQKADWADVVLDEEFKTRVQSDVYDFYKSEKVYKDLGIGWKRGVIFLGPPGNGKTISLKAFMKTVDVPSLYVRSFHSFAGDEYAIQQVFTEARNRAPCLLILEDLDSIITDANRSFFLNEVDGLSSNDGILMIGTTNHFDRLDPGLSSRPSRFDRKFTFDNPSLGERIEYCKYWRNKLRHNPRISFPKSLMEHIAQVTKDFSFAYLKEAFVSSLISIAGGTAKGEFADVIEAQIKSLRKELENGPQD